MDLIVVTRRPLSVSADTLLHRRLLEPEEEVPDLAAQVHVLDDVEVVAEREILVDDLDPELRRVLRAVDRDLLAVEEDLAGVVAVDAGDALDERRLAGAVVADERHDLARAHLEVDVGQRLHRAERLREVADLEEWCVAHEWRVLERAVEAPRHASTAAIDDYLQYCLYSPEHTSLRLRNLSRKSRV